jgi:hypothetical protein
MLLTWKVMALKFFWTYIGICLACSVTLAALVKQFSSGFAASGKKPYWYGLFSSLLASAVAYISTLVSAHLFTVYWILTAIYLLFGLIHMTMVHKKYFSRGKQDAGKVIMGEIIFGLSIILMTVVIFSALQYFLTQDKSYLFYPLLMSTISFFIPFLFMQTFEAAYSIPSAVFKTWQYPLGEMIDVPEERPGERIILIAFEISKKISYKEKSHFRAKAPEGMTLGELYYHFINDYNEEQSETPIDYTDEGHEPYIWWFRRKPKWYQREKILDPHVTMRENGIKENTIIICERINHTLQTRLQ